MKLTHKCAHCGGTGMILLTGVYADTLAMLRKQTGPVSGAALAEIAGCKGPAMCNRLVALEKLGFAKSERYGRERRFSAKGGA